MDHHGLWKRLSGADRDALLKMPMIGYRYEPDKKWTGGRTVVLEMRPDVCALLANAGLPPKSESLHLLLRLIQVCHASGNAFAPGTTPEKLAAHLKDFVLIKVARHEFSDSDQRPSWSIRAADEPGPIEFARFGSKKRLERFMAIAPGISGAKWEAAERANATNGGALAMLSGLHVTDFAKAIMKRLIAEGQPVALDGLLSSLGAGTSQASVVAKALRALVQWVFVFVDYDSDLRGLRIGLWPLLQAALLSNSQAAPRPPALKEPAETFSEAFLCADMAVLIAAAAAQPLQLKKGRDVALFAADERELITQLGQSPDWAGVSREPERLDTAFWALQALGMLVVSNGPARVASVSTSGRQWLAMGASACLQDLMDRLRNRRWNPQKTELAIWGFTPIDGKYRRSLAHSDVLVMEDALCEAWLQAPHDEWFDFDAWLEYAARVHNPIARAAGGAGKVIVARQRMWGGYDWVSTDVEVLGKEAREVLTRFFTERLLPLGGVELGRLSKNKVAVRLTELGRYYMGDQPRFPLLADIAAGRVVLQPNFEIVFLGPNLAAEAAIGGFCERVGRRTGLLFRLTRASLQNAIHAGYTLQTILKVLEETTSKPIPANVKAELTAWDSSRRTFKVGEAILLRCPDHNVALRIHGILRDCSALLSQTVIELSGPLTLPQRRKLIAAGFFQEKTSGIEATWKGSTASGKARKSR